MSNITQSEVIAAMEKALEIKSGQLKESTRAEEIDNWDSLGQISILVALDKLFDGKVASITDMAEADSVDKIINIFKHHSLL